MNRSRLCHVSSFFRASLTVLFFLSAVSAPAGVFLHNYELSVIQTKYFDIIYPEKSAQSAQLLAVQADGLMEKASKLLHTRPLLRLPVVITPDTDQLNAYFTPVPFNRIVLFDTPCDEGSLAVFSDMLVSVFYHELVHAVSINIKSEFWQTASEIFGDAASPTLFLNLPTSFIEGVTVSFESADGEGRLNDAQALHLLIQSKIEGAFPDWQQVSGVRDVYPSGSPPYIFGGAFSAFLQQKFGMEKYAEYWHECGRVHFFTLAAGIFKKVYQKDINDVWKEFYQSIQVPSVSQPLDSLQLSRSSLVSSVSSAGSAAVWIDVSRSKVMISSVSDDGTRNTRTLFNCSSQENRAVLSGDGSVLAVSSSVPHAAGSSNFVRLFDMKTESFFAEFDSLRDACIIGGEKQYICGVQTQSANSSLVVYDVKTGALVRRIDFDRSVIPLTPSDAGNGFVSFIAKTSGARDLVLYDIERGILYTYPLKDTGFIPRYLSHHSEKGTPQTSTLSFSWNPSVPDGTLTRAGIFSVQHSTEAKAPEITYSLQKNDYSGGVFMPSVVSVPSGKKAFVYYASFYENHRVSLMSFSENDLSAPQKIACTPEISSQQYGLQTSHNSKEMDVMPSQKYNPASFMTRGIMYPFLSLSSIYGMSLTGSSSDLGFGYYTMDPTETWEFIGEGQYKAALSSAGIFVSLTHTGGIFRTAVQTTADFGMDGGVTADGVLNMSMPLYIKGSDGVFAVGNTFSLRYTDSGVFASSSDSSSGSDWVYPDGFIFADVLAVQYSYSKPHGLGAYENLSFSATAAGVFLLEPTDTSSGSYKSPSLYPSVSASFGVPRLLPLHNPRGFTVNLPSVLSCSFLPSGKTQNPYDTTKYDDIFLKADFSSVLFSVEIQKSFRNFPLYMRRFAFSAGYSMKLIPQDGIIDYDDVLGIFSLISGMQYRDAVTVEAKLYNAVIGGYVRELPTTLCLSVSYMPYISEFSYSFITKLDL